MQALFRKPKNSLWFRYFPRIAGAGVALFGLLVMATWHGEWRPILRLLPDAPAIPFNTALCFALTGTALMLLTRGCDKIALWPAGISLVLSTLTLVENLTGRDFNIDELFYRHSFDAAMDHRVRMAALSAVCFIFIATSILLVGLKKWWPQRLTAAGMMACVVSAVAVASLSGFSLGGESGAGWDAYSSMAANTAAAFMLLGTGLLAWTWQTARQESFNFLRWLPVTASVTLMTLVAFVSVANMNDLKHATYWRQHTFQVLLNVQAYDNNVADMQRAVRSYVTTGDTNALATYRACRKLEPQQFNTLASLVSDNPGQGTRLNNLMTAMTDVFNYDEKVIFVYDRKGSNTAVKTDSGSEAKKVLASARDNLKKFRHAEQDLLAARDTIEQADYRNTAQLLVWGSILAAALLILSSKMASRELFHRQQAEQRLREVTTLQNAIFSSADYAIISLDPNGVVQTFNPAAERMLGYAADEVIGKATPMLWRDKMEVTEEAKKLSDEVGYPVKPGVDVITKRPFPSKGREYEATFIHKSGRRFPVLVSLTALANDADTVTGFLGVVADITERKRAEEKIRESEERFRSALDNAPIGMSLVSLEGRWLKVNVALCNMLGYSEAELLKTDFQHVTHPADLEKDLDLLKQVLDGTLASYQMEKRYFNKVGGVVNVMLSVSLVRNQHQQPLYFVSQLENITERKRREAEREKLISDLQQALMEVKTLSGMIPICGWCKSVRSDEGYWQTVEQYVRSHTNATFSHGMCPKCTEKFRTDILRENYRA